jgi:dihydrofolate reductase
MNTNTEKANISRVAQSIILVAAMDKALAIGRANSLPWHLPDDFAHFKRMTEGKLLIMGFSTAQGLGRPLPRRRTIVLSRQGRAPFPGIEVCRSISDVLKLTQGQDIIVGGGEQVYAAFLPIATHMSLTMIDTVAEGTDTFFPEWNKDEWQETSKLHHAVDERHAHAFDIVELLRVGNLSVNRAED